MHDQEWRGHAANAHSHCQGQGWLFQPRFTTNGNQHTGIGDANQVVGSPCPCCGIPPPTASLAPVMGPPPISVSLTVQLCI